MGAGQIEGTSETCVRRVLRARRARPEGRSDQEHRDGEVGPNGGPERPMPSGGDGIRVRLGGSRRDEPRRCEGDGHGEPGRRFRCNGGLVRRPVPRGAAQDRLGERAPVVGRTRSSAGFRLRRATRMGRLRGKIPVPHRPSRARNEGACPCYEGKGEEEGNGAGRVHRGERTGPSTPRSRTVPRYHFEFQSSWP
jgi:hypothetical protein